MKTYRTLIMPKILIKCKSTEQDCYIADLKNSVDILIPLKED